LPFEIREGLTYGPNERNDLDLFLPKDDGKSLRPAVIVIHGGAWRSGDKRQLRNLAELFARRGYVAAAINYRLAPKWSYPAQLDDCQRAVRWLRKNAKEFRVDPKRLVLLERLLEVTWLCCLGLVKFGTIVTLI
jgi:acetyl esterase/lipase